MYFGSNVARDLGGAQVGDSVKVLVVDRWGEDQIRRFTVTGIAESPGGQGFDYTAVVHIDTLRDMMSRPDGTGSFMVKLNDHSKAFEVKEFFLRSFPNDDFIAETTEEASEEQLEGFRSGIAMINMIGYFGMMSSAFAIVTIQMMLVNGKTKRDWRNEINWSQKKRHSHNLHLSRNDYWSNWRWCGNCSRTRLHILCKGDKNVV